MNSVLKEAWQHSLLNHVCARLRLHWQYQVTLPRLQRLTLAGITLDVSRHSRVMKKIIRDGAYEAQERRLAERYLDTRDSVLELGGAIGFLGLFCRKKFGITRYVTVEANPATADILRENYRLNQCVPELWNLAVAPSDGTVSLDVSGEFWANAILEHEAQKGSFVTVPALTMESLLARLDFTPTTLIVDVEGAEQWISFRTLPTGITKVLIELHPRLIGPTKTFQIVADLVYSGFRVAEESEHTFMFMRGS